MSRAPSPAWVARLPAHAGFPEQAGYLVRGGMEAVLLIMVCLSPWAFGAAEVQFEFILYVGVAVLFALWGARILLEGQLSCKKCPVALCLAVLILIGVWQLIPFPHRVLSWLSPATARLYDQLLPARAEVLPFGETAIAPPSSSGLTISFYPGRTRQELIRVMAVFMVFAAVRNNIASTASLMRLSVAVLANGTLLSLFALTQFFTSSPDTLYWTYRTAGTVFGPFICRNHFAFYINLCVGLGAGLLVSCRDLERGDRKYCDRFASTWSLLHDTRALWTTVALALMLSSVAVCISRGGILSLLGGWSFCLLIKLSRPGRFSRLGAVCLILSMALALVTWLGLDRVEARLRTLWKGQVLQESRLPLWSRTLPLVKDFPIWGTGYGTFQYLEPLRRSDPTDQDGIYSNAENDYLEALLEGGLVRLIFSALTIGLVFRLGYRAVCHGDSRRHTGLAMGALFGFTTMVIHSFGDFGLHIPAITLLATVLCAHLCALGRTRADSGIRQAGGPVDYCLQLWGLAPMAGAVVAVALGLVLSYEGWRAYQIQRLRLVASRPGQLSGLAAYQRRIDCLAEAVRLGPDYARLQLELALTHYDRYREQKRKLSLSGRLTNAVQAVSDFSPVWFPVSVAHPALAITPIWVATSGARAEFGKDEERQLARKYLVPALRHFMQARDLCPLLPEPQRCLADNANKLQSADARVTYLERVARLVPYDPGIWYLCGREHLGAQPSRTWECWRRSLELSDLYLPQILARSIARLEPRAIIDQLLPDKADLLLKGALRLYPQPTIERQPFLDKALVILGRQPLPWRAEDFHMKALIHSALGQSEDALIAYQAALDREPYQVSWRFEFARLLRQHGRLQESRRELIIVLSQEPGHIEARELLTVVERQVAESM